MNTSPSSAEPAKPKLTWYQHAWIGWPIALIAVGGAIGGACGGLAWVINQKVFQPTKNPVLRYLWTGLISIAAILTYLVLAVIFISFIPKRP